MDLYICINELMDLYVLMNNAVYDLMNPFTLICLLMQVAPINISNFF